MVSGVDVSKYDPLVVEGLVKAQLDSQLIDYYKLVVQTNAAFGDVENAKANLERLLKLIYMDDSETKTKTDKLVDYLEEVSTWNITIDTRSIELPNNRLIPKKKPLKSW